MVELRYPGGKKRVVNFSYDDGVLQDIPLVDMMNRYNLKGTFNLNSALMQEAFTWIHPCGMPVTRLSPQQAAGLYTGHEVASHTQRHPYMDNFSREQILRELSEDRQALKQLFADPICGYATPFHFYSSTLADCVRACGFSYGRVSQMDASYTPWRERYSWKPGIFHEDPGLQEYIDGFLRSQQSLAFCQVVGHSYDLEASNHWARMEEIFYRISCQEDVWSATHLQIVTYLQALQQLVQSDHHIHNPSPECIWIAIDGQPIVIPPRSTLSL